MLLSLNITVRRRSSSNATVMLSCWGFSSQVNNYEMQRLQVICCHVNLVGSNAKILKSDIYRTSKRLEDIPGKRLRYLEHAATCYIVARTHSAEDTGIVNSTFITRLRETVRAGLTIVEKAAMLGNGEAIDWSKVAMKGGTISQHRLICDVRILCRI